MNEPSIKLKCTLWRGNGLEPETFTKLTELPLSGDKLSGLHNQRCIQPSKELELGFYLYWSDVNQRYESFDGRVTLAP